MYRRSVNPVLGVALLNAALDALAVSVPPIAALLDGAILKLFSNNPVVSMDSEPGDFTECAFDGYAAATPLTWTGPHRPDDSSAAVRTQAIFTAGAALAGPETIAGYIVVNGAEDTIWVAELFPEAAGIEDVGNFLELDVYLQLQAMLEVQL